jgi:hypothetical protein
VRKSKAVTWVVYQMTVHGKPSGANAVCEQAEWDAMEHARVGYHQLVLDGIATETEAEKLARAGQVAKELALAEEKRRARRS